MMFIALAVIGIIFIIGRIVALYNSNKYTKFKKFKLNNIIDEVTNQVKIRFGTRRELTEEEKSEMKKGFEMKVTIEKKKEDEKPLGKIEDKYNELFSEDERAAGLDTWFYKKYFKIKEEK